MSNRIIISWDYGIRLLDKDYLVSELIRLKDKLANFNWDYMLVPNPDGSYHKVKDFDRIDRHHDWLTKAIPELEKMCKERGIDFEKEAHRLELRSLAAKLNDFYKEFDFYDYMDSVESFESTEDVVASIEGQLTDAVAVSGILDALCEIQENGELDEEQSKALDFLIDDVLKVQASFGKSVDEVLTDAVLKSEVQNGKSDISKDDRNRIEVEKE